MFHQELNFSLRIKLIVWFAVVLLSGLTAVVFSRGVLFNRLEQQPPIRVTVPLAAAFVPSGLPVVLANASATVEWETRRNTRLVSSVDFQVATIGGEKLTSLNVMVLEFDERGQLRQIDGFVRTSDLSAGKPETVVLPIDRQVPNGSRLALAVERADGATKRWEADFNDLARGVATLIAGNPTANVSARNETFAPPDTGAAVCSNAYRRAMALSNSGAKSGLTSFTCNQHKRAFAFSFNGKSLL